MSALSGFNTFILDLNKNSLKRGLETIEGNLQRQVKKEKISQSEMDSALGKIISITDYDDLSVCDVIIEAATENQSVKEKYLHPWIASVKQMLSLQPIHHPFPSLQ